MIRADRLRPRAGAGWWTGSPPRAVGPPGKRHALPRRRFDHPERLHHRLAGLPVLSVYSASKAAVRSFARTWSTDLKGKNIRVNVISPGVVPTPGYQTSLGMSEQQVSQFVEQMVPGIPLGRVGTTDEVAKTVSFLASDESNYVAGVELFPDGGMTQV